MKEQHYKTTDSEIVQELFLAAERINLVNRLLNELADEYQANACYCKFPGAIGEPSTQLGGFGFESGTPPDPENWKKGKSPNSYLPKKSSRVGKLRHFKCWRHLHKLGESPHEILKRFGFPTVTVDNKNGTIQGVGIESDFHNGAVYFTLPVAEDCDPQEVDPRFKPVKKSEYYLAMENR